MTAAETFPAACTIRNWRGVKHFKTDAVPEKLIGELLNIAVWAPSSKQREPWRFIVFIGEGTKIIADAIARNGLKKRDPVKLAQIPAYVLVVIGESDDNRKADQDYAAACSLIQNFRLAAWERGLGVVWKSEPYTYNPAFWKETGIMPGEKLVGMLQIGYPEALHDNEERRIAAEQKWTVVRSASLKKDDFSDGTIGRSAQ